MENYEQVKHKAYYVPVRELELLENNPRTISKEQFDKLKKSVAERKAYFEGRPCLVNHKDGNMIVFAGNQRLRAARDLKMDKVPCVVYENLSKKEEKELTVLDNGEFGRWDMEILANEFSDLPLEELMGEEFDKVATELTPEQEIEEDEPPEVDESEPAKSKPGEVYLLGNHRLMCGDSTDEAQVARLMDGNKADMVFTDPPYGVNMSRSLVSGKDNSILNDNLDEKEFCSLLDKAVSNMRNYSYGKYIFLWIGFRAYSKAETIIKKYYDIDNCIVWVKPSIGLGGKGYRFQHELCIFCGEIQNKSLSDVWEFDRDSQGLHPTMKPVQLVCKALKDCASKTVLDLFGGSGSTLIACEQTNRKCYMMELDPKYCDVIRKRWVKFTTGSEDNWEELTPKAA